MISADPVLSSPTVGRRLAYRLVIRTVMLCAYDALAMLWHWGPRSVYFDVLRFVGIEPFRFPFGDIHAVLAAVEGGKITPRGSLPPLPAYRGRVSRLARAYDAHGVPCLRATRLRQYRTPSSPRPRRPRR